MNCEECREQLHAYVDGEMTDDVRTFIDGHLEGCLPCFERAELEGALRKALRDRAGASVPDGLEDRLRAALAQAAAAPEPRTARPSRWAWAAAAVALLALGAALGAAVAAWKPSATVAANPVQVRGMLYCPGCVYQARSRTAEAALLPGAATDPAEAHAVLHLRTDDGTDWQLVAADEITRGLLTHANAPRRAFVLGTAFPASHLIQTARLHLE